MGVPSRYYVFVDGKTAAGLLTADRLNGNLDPLYACLDPETGGLEDTNVKADAKIVCTDRVHTITAAWTFAAAPVLPAASVDDAALSANIMKRTVYDTDADGQVEDTDTVDGQHASAFAVAAHNHNLNDLTEKSYNSLTDKPSTGYAMTIVGGLIPNPSDGSTYYCGSHYYASLGSTAGLQRMYIPKAGTIKVAQVFWYADFAGTGENVSVYIRLNNSSDTLIATLGNTDAAKVFSKTDLSIAVAQGDYIEIKIVSPTWATNPQNVYLGGAVYIE